MSRSSVGLCEILPEATVPGMSNAAHSAYLISTMALNDNKAGMEGLDKEKINQIIYEASKGSKFFENEQKKEEQLNLRIKEQQTLINGLTQSQLLHGLKEADELIQKLKDQRDLSRTIVHVDMDAFYAAVEMRDDPRLRDKPMAVGGMSMLSTSNYIARRYGVRAAMPGFIALKLCPNLILVEPNFTKYIAVSQDIREIFAEYDPNFSPMSLDEAYLDLTGHLHHRNTSTHLSRLFLHRLKTENNGISPNYNSECLCDLNSVLRPCVINSEKLKSISALSEDLSAYLSSLDIADLELISECPVCHKILPPFILKLYGVSAEEAVMEMRNRIEQRTFLTASAGIAPNAMLAKVCSDKNKPNGQFRISPNLQEVEEFIKNLPIRKISGIGKVTEKLLGSLNISLCSDLYLHRALLYHAFSSISFNYFMRITLGMGSTFLERDEERKSLSTERTFSEIHEPSQLYEKCAELCQHLTKDLDEEQLMGKTVSIKIKTISFEVKTRSQTLQSYTNDERTIFKSAKQLLKNEIDAMKPNVLRLRLMGVRLSKLVPQSSKQVTIDNMFKHVNKDFGTAEKNATTFAQCEKIDSSLGNKEVTVKCSGNISGLSDDSRDDINLWEPVKINYSSATEKSADASTGKKNYSKKCSDTAMKNSIMKFVCKTDKNKTDEISSNICTDNKGILYEGMNGIKEHTDLNTCPKTDCNMKSDLLLGLEPKICKPSGNSPLILTQKAMIICPICGQQKFDWPLDQLNRHVDLCLSRKTIQNILRDDQNSELLKPLNKRPAVHLSNDELSLQSESKRTKTQIPVNKYFNAN